MFLRGSGICFVWMSLDVRKGNGMMRVLFGMLCVACAAGAAAGEVWVKAGAAGGDGSKKRPFATLAQARDAVRAAREKEAVGSGQLAVGSKQGDAPDAYTVRVAAGTYALTEPFTLEPRDSGVEYVGAGMEKTRVTGGIVVGGWEETGDGVWSVPVPAGADGKPAYFESLFVNGKRAVRARHPNTGFFSPKALKQTLLTNANPRAEYAVAELTGAPGDLAPLAGTPEAELRFAQVVVHHNWDTTRRIVLGFDAATETLRTQGGKWKPWNPWRTNSLYYVENVRQAFDAPGEWLYDGARGRILYRPRKGERLPGSWWGGAEIVAPVPGLQTLVVFKGDIEATNFVRNIRFKDIAFLYTDSPRRADQVEKAFIAPGILGAADRPGPTQFEPMQAAARTEAAVMADGAHDIAFEDCEVAHTGEYGIWFRAGCVSNRVLRCALDDLGAGGIRIGDPGGKGVSVTSNAVAAAAGPYWTAFNEVDNCIVTRGGRFHASATAMWIGHSPDNRITHNEIRDHFYTGVSVGWVWGYRGSVAQRNLVACNRISRIGQGALGDMGGVYTLGTSFGTVVRNNVIFDVDSYTYGGWGLYPDEGSEGIVFENNLVYDTKDSSFHQHYGRDNIVRNNILAFSRQYQVAVTRAEPHRSAVIEGNIIYWERPGEGLATKRYRGTEKAKVDWLRNLWWCADGPVDFNGKTFEEWQAEGRDAGGLVADPLFEDPGARDFRLKRGSPASAIGFKPFDFSEAGVTGDRAWRRRARR
jgi:hypothetical protein